MLTKYKMEAVRMDELKRRLFNELEMHEAEAVACKDQLEYGTVDCIYKLCKTLYYLDCITKGDAGKHHHHIHYKGDDVPEQVAGSVHHHVEYKEDVSANMHATRATGMI